MNGGRTVRVFCCTLKYLYYPSFSSMPFGPTPSRDTPPSRFASRPARCINSPKLHFCSHGKRVPYFHDPHLRKRFENDKVSEWLLYVLINISKVLRRRVRWLAIASSPSLTSRSIFIPRWWRDIWGQCRDLKPLIYTAAVMYFLLIFYPVFLYLYPPVYTLSATLCMLQNFCDLHLSWIMKLFWIMHFD